MPANPLANCFLTAPIRPPLTFISPRPLALLLLHPVLLCYRTLAVPQTVNPKTRKPVNPKPSQEAIKHVAEVLPRARIVPPPVVVAVLAIFAVLPLAFASVQT